MFVKHFFAIDDIVVLDMEGTKLEGKHQASSEIKMHLNLYQIRGDIRSIFHAHPRHCLLCAINDIEINTHISQETSFMLKKVAYLPYCQPGTEQFAENFIEDAKKAAMHLFWKIMV